MADELEMVRRMADGTPRYMATEEDTRALARVIVDLGARVEALEAERRGCTCRDPRSPDEAPCDYCTREPEPERRP